MDAIGDKFDEMIDNMVVVVVVGRVGGYPIEGCV